MNYDQELKKSLNELKRITGLTFSVEVNDEDQIHDTIHQIQALSRAFKEKNNKDLVMKKWLTGSILKMNFWILLKKCIFRMKKTVFYI